MTKLKLKFSFHMIKRQNYLFPIAYHTNVDIFLNPLPCHNCSQCHHCRTKTFLHEVGRYMIGTWLLFLGLVHHTYK